MKLKDPEYKDFYEADKERKNDELVSFKDFKSKAFELDPGADAPVIEQYY